MHIFPIKDIRKVDLRSSHVRLSATLQAYTLASTNVSIFTMPRFLFSETGFAIEHESRGLSLGRKRCTEMQMHLPETVLSR